MAAVKWTAAMHARLVELNGHFDNRTLANMLSVEFGIRITRNAVIGKCHRLGYGSGKTPGVDPHKRKRKRKAAVVIVASPSLPDPPPPPEPPLPVRRPGDPVPLIELQVAQCKYPVEGPPFLFCARPTPELASYCEEHYALCHTGAARTAAVDRRMGKALTSVK